MDEPTKSDATEPPKLPRIWAAHCPFRKSGSPVLGNVGATIRPVIVMEMDTWTRLCQDVPALQTMQFEVGTFE
jgi:hypothetical protein